MQRVITQDDARRLAQHRAARGAAKAGESISVLSTTRGAEGAPAAEQKVPDAYWTRLQKLIPAEIVAAFLAIDGVVQAKVGIPVAGYWAIYVILVILCVLYALKATTTAELGTSYRQVILATIAFLVWTYAIGGPFEFGQLDWWIRPLGGVLVVLFTTAAPLVVEKGLD